MNEITTEYIQEMVNFIEQKERELQITKLKNSGTISAADIVNEIIKKIDRDITA